MSNKDLRDRRRAQKEANMLREISKLFMQLSQDNSELAGISVSRVKLSPDKSHCTIFFYLLDGEEKFQEKFSTLILYKPSLRKALSQAIPSRYTPDLVFKYDTLVEKQRRVDDIIIELMEYDKMKKEESS
ncbi:30S ribosome-binding factor RbfA [Candidatus Dependentiae bacterium]|nr:30S ribosome-binding factor RbfA [Candidatus Dependentiae bacterium]